MVRSLLRLDSVSRSFGGLVAVRDVTLDVSAGEAHCIIGPNGAGKTTLFKLISGELRPNRGQIFFCEESITNRSQHWIANQGLIRTYQVTRIYPTLTVEEHLRLGALNRKRGHRLPGHAAAQIHEKVERALELTAIAQLRRQRGGTLAHGDRRRLELALAIAAEPRLLMLDEPTQGMSPQETWETVSLLKRLREALPELAILLIEHDMEVVMEFSDLLTVLHNGTVIASGPPQQIEQDTSVQEAYLGADLNVAT